jgi:hypothetical protein
MTMFSEAVTEWMGELAMEIDAFLADAAESVNGKIYALGVGWNILQVAQFPTVHPRIAIGITIHVPYTATNQNHALLVHLEDEDGNRIPLGERPGVSPDDSPQQVGELGGEFNVGRPPLLPPGDEQVITLALAVNGMRFERPGLFTWTFTIDGTPMKRLPMRVLQVPQVGSLGR